MNNNTQAAAQGDQLQTNKLWIQELTAQVMAAEMQLSHFAVRHGKESEVYQSALKDFATAWYLLKKS